MSRDRWVRWLVAPRTLVVPVVIATGVLAGCHAARPAGWASFASPPTAFVRVALAKQATKPHLPPGLVGKTWLAEGPRGWESGKIGGRRVTLGKDEVGLAASDGWVISAVLRPVTSITLLVREGPGAAPKTIALGSLAPTATVIAGDRAFVSGFLFGSRNDSGILEIDLAAAVARPVLEPSDVPGTRYLAVSPDGATLVSTLCDLAPSPEPVTCILTDISLADGTVRTVGKVPGGLLRGTSSDVAVVAQQGAEAPAWIAGIDLRLGTELWRIAGGELGASVMSQDGLVQERVLTGGPTPKLAVEIVSLRSGARRTVYEETRLNLRSIWPALTSELQIALGDDATGSRAIGGRDDAHVPVRLVPIDGGAPVDVDLSLRSDP